MSVRVMTKHSWVRKVVGIILVMVLLSPVFAWAAQQVGYAEPLTNAAEKTGAADAAQTINPGLLPGYTVPGLNVYLGTALSGLIGAVLTLLVAVGVGRVLQT
jgi:cobalt/nickel transport protein